MESVLALKDTILMIENAKNALLPVPPAHLPPIVIPVLRTKTPEMDLKWDALVCRVSMMMERMWSVRNAVWNVKPVQAPPSTASDAGRVRNSRKWGLPADA